MINSMIPALAALFLSLIVLYMQRMEAQRINEELDRIVDAILDLREPVQAPVIKQQGPKASDSLPLQGHTIIVGQSGSGKSNVIMSQIMRRLADKQQLHVIDTKGEIAPIFGRHVSCVDTSGAKAKFRELLAQAELRRDMFAIESANAEQPIRDYSEYFKVTGHKLPIITLFVEELIVTMDDIEEEQLVKLLVLGRSAGVFVVAASQYLTADILSRKGSVNFNCRVYLGKPDPITFGVLFGTRKLSSSVEDFLGSPGKAVIEEKGDYRCVTMPEITSDILKPYMRKQ